MILDALTEIYAVQRAGLRSLRSSDPALQSQYHKQLDHLVIDFLAVLEEFRRPFEVSFQLYVRVSLLFALGL